LRIQRLETRRFRNLVDGATAYEPGINWLVGPNGQGKTNALEAVYFLTTSKSFRSSRISDMARAGDGDFETLGDIVKGEGVQRLAVRFEDGKCQRFVGGKVCPAMDFLEQAAAMAFTARDKRLIEGSPEDRRRFLDRMVSYLEPDHILDLGRYRRIHGQLRQVLQKDRDRRVYEGFKKLLAPVAERIVARRLRLLEDQRDAMLSLYHDLFSGDEEPYFAYDIKKAQSIEDYQSRLIKISAQELLYEKSLIGPHLDDLDILFQGNKAKRFASSGQVRAIALSLKLAVREAFFRLRGRYPLLLLDDIDAELDPARLKRLIDFLAARGQTLATTSKYATIEGWQGCVFEVKNGSIHRERNTE